MSDAIQSDEVTPAHGSGGPRLEGLVVAQAPGLFEVYADGQTYLCTLRGRLRKKRPPAPPPNAKPLFRGRPGAPGVPARFAPRQQQPTPPEGETLEAPVRVAPGDRVLFTALGNGEGVIEEVLPRTTLLARARPEVGTEHIMLANPDQAVLVFAMREPAPHFGLLDRYLALTEHAHVPATIILNKADLGAPPDVEEAAWLYASLGYPVIRTSAANGDGVDDLRALLSGKISLLSGPSGVGKSSLMNVLIPGAGQRTGEISTATGKGRHTTTGARLLPLPEGGWLADSAGIRELALWSVPADELAATFVELRPYVGECEYEDCSHSADEGGCALRQALAEGKITPERFASFERLLAAAHDEERPAWEQDGRAR